MNTKLINNLKKSVVKVSSCLMAACIAVTIVGAEVNVSAAEAETTTTATTTTATTTVKKVSLSKPKLISATRYENSDTHPFNKQTNTLVVRWNAVKNAKQYQVYVKGGKYKNWTKYKTVNAKYTKCTVTGLKRATEYTFKVRAVNGTSYSAFSGNQLLKTARMDFDRAGWEAMCRIVYHEVGQINNSTWDKPMVYVSDCIVNRYSAAKYYSGSNAWKSSYRNYSNIQSIIYNSGGFMSSAGLTRDGATYARVPARVKNAVYSAVYDVTSYKGIKHDYDIYFWSNTSYRPNSYKVAYSYRIPWGYFNIWRSYWG